MNDNGRKVLMLGGVVYIISFFLFATSPYHRGWADAVLALQLPLEELMRPSGVEPAVGPLALVAITITGFINIVFIVAAIQRVVAPAGATFRALRIAVILMMPVCWVVFRNQDLRPREGYVLWTLGMLLVLFSDRLGRFDDPIAPPLSR
jgi:hypothetical protein